MGESAKRRFSRFRTVLVLGAGIAIAIALAGGIFVRSRSGALVRVTSRPAGVMGTECELTLVVPSGKTDLGEEVLRRAETALRDVETRMSTHLDVSEVARLNSAGAGEVVGLSAETLELLRISRDLSRGSEGAFDVTCAPIVEVWKRAGKRGTIPSQGEIEAARRESGWTNIELLPHGARKRISEARIDLGGIAKGYGIDRAARVITEGGVLAALINVGGDVKCLGTNQGGDEWTVGVQSPFEEDLIATLKLSDLAVCTSGNYRRFVEIDGKRYSHIVDPRTGRPAEMTPSVTVVAPSATVADAWATALSVLGIEGLDLLPPGGGIEAMILVGDEEGHEFHVTPGFEALFVERPNGVIKAHGPTGRMGPETDAYEESLSMVED